MIYHHDQGLHGHSLHKSMYKDTAFSHFHVEKTFSSQNPCTRTCHSVRISRYHLCTKTSFPTFVHVQRVHSLHMSMYRDCILFICPCTKTAFSSNVHEQRRCIFFINPCPRRLHTHCLLTSTHKDLPLFAFRVWRLVYCHSIHISTHKGMPPVILFMLPGTQTPILSTNPWTTTPHSLHSYMNKSTAFFSCISKYMYRDIAFSWHPCVQRCYILFTLHSLHTDVLKDAVFSSNVHVQGHCHSGHISK